jgi:hypothetical protein
LNRSCLYLKVRIGSIFLKTDFISLAHNEAHLLGHNVAGDHLTGFWSGASSWLSVLSACQRNAIFPFSTMYPLDSILSLF